MPIYLNLSKFLSKIGQNRNLTLAIVFLALVLIDSVKILVACIFAIFLGSIAQSVEQETENLRVGGSIPPRATIFSITIDLF